MSTHDLTVDADILPGYSIGTLRQVLSVYGRLQYLSRGIDSFDGYQPYFTPWKVEDSASVVVADLDLTGDDIAVEDVWVRGLESSDPTDRLGYSWYFAANGHDYSFTHATSNSDPETVAKWLVNGLTRWAPADETPAYPREAIEGHPDEWVIDRLDAVSDDTVEALRGDVKDAAPETGEQKLVTARFRLPEADVTQHDERVDRDGGTVLAYPGQLDVCNRVMKAARVAGYKTMNSVDGFVSGPGTDMNSNQQGEVVSFATDHLKHYTSKQRERFPGFDVRTAWQVHPVSEEEALYLDAAEDYIDACHSSFGLLRVYHLPYFLGTMTPAQGEALLDFLEHLVATRDDESGTRASALTHFRDFAAVRDDETLKDVRFWTVFQQYKQKDRRNVFREEAAVRVQPAERIAREHVRMLATDRFGRRGLPLSDTDAALTRPGIDRDDVARMVESGWYVTRTFPEYSAGTDEDPEPAADDPRPRVTAELLSEGAIETEFLLSEYVTALGEAYDGDGSTLRFRISEQAAQLQALAAADLLEASDDTQTDLTNPPLMSDDDSTNESTARTAILGDETDTGSGDGEQTSADRAREIVEGIPALANSDDRAAAFLLGYTTGMMSRYQAGVEEMQRTFAARYPAHDLTVTGAKRLYTELQGKAVAYADGGGSIYRDLIAEMTERSPRPPDEWALSLVDMRFHFGEGVALALSADRASSSGTDSEDQN